MLFRNNITASECVDDDLVAISCCKCEVIDSATVEVKW